MEKGKKLPIEYCFANVGGQRLKVDLPMSKETLQNLARAQSGIPAPMTEQMKLINIPPKEPPLRKWRRFVIKGFPLEN